MFRFNSPARRAVAVLCLCLSWARVASRSEAAEVEAPSSPLIEMPAKVVATIEQAIRKFPSAGSDPENLRQAIARKHALQSLEKLRRLRWPDYSKLKLVKIEDVNAAFPSRHILVAWVGAANSETISVLTLDNELVPVPAKRYRIEPFPFERYWKSYRQQLLQTVDPDVEYVEWVTGGRSPGEIGPRPQYDARKVVGFVHLAAAFEKTKDLTLILDKELDAGAWGDEGPFLSAWQKFHDQRVGSAAQLLTTGAPFTEILSRWREIVRLFEDAALRPLIQRLEQQIADDRDLKVLAADVISQMTAADQARYWRSRLPEDRGYRADSDITRLPKATAVTALADLGWHAMPHLIAALRDTRITRIMAAQDWDVPARYLRVLRVQDLALKTLRGLTDEAFPVVNGQELSTATAEQQAKVVAKIEAWWQEHGQDSERAWLLSRLEHQKLSTRIRALATLERLDPKAVDSIAKLLAWAESAQQHEFLTVSDALQQRGFSGPIPQLDHWLNVQRQNSYQQAMPYFLLRHGELQDFRYLQQCVRRKVPAHLSQDIRSRIVFGLTIGSYGYLVSQPPQLRSLKPFAIPLLVDVLDRDRLVGMLGPQEDSPYASEFSEVTTALGMLQRLTGHDVGGDAKASLPDRKAAIDRWLAWWHETGRQDFLKKHPEASPLFEDAWQKGAAVAGDELPELVDAEDPRDFCRITYRIPRDSVAKLVAEGSLLVNTVPQFADRFRFATSAVAEKWFRSESPVSGRQLPSMIVPISDNLELDSRGRIWCRWDLFGYPPAVFDKGQWTTFADQRIPGSWALATYPGNTGATTSWEMVYQPTAGVAGAMLFPCSLQTEGGSKFEMRYDLVDDQGWLRFSVTDFGAAASFNRILKALPLGRIKHDDHYHIARDEAGRIFFSKGDWGIVEKGQEVPKSARLRDLRASSYTPLGVIGDGSVWLVSRYAHAPAPSGETLSGQTQFIALTVEKGEVVEKRLPLSPQIGPPRVWLNSGPIESSTPANNRGRSVMGWDAQGNVVARHEGHLVWEDPRGGRWLVLGPRGAIESLQRIDAAGRTLSWKNPNFQGPNIWAETLFELAPAPDGTVWGLFGPELLHLRCDDQAIKVVERYPLPEPKWKRIRCDNNGDVWVVFQDNQGNDRRPRLYRFATSSKSSGDQR